LANLLNQLFAPRVAVRVYGLGAIVFALIGFCWGDFAVVWQPDPDVLPPRSALAYAAAVPFLLAGLAIQWKRAAGPAALALTVMYALGALLLHIPRVIAKPSIFGGWEGAAEQLALVAGGLLAYAVSGSIRPSTVARLRGIARLIFGLCLIIFGLAHFFYLQYTADMVPAWLPPNQMFWVYVTAVGHLAAGLAVLSGIAARPACILLTAMFVVFGVLVHAPTIVFDPRTHNNWAENGINFALIGSAWLMAATVRRTRTG
jgi:uncharacterized membrane protein YphA (DoxX/SURF4 family)